VEKSLENTLKRSDLITMSPLVLAYIGDTVYETYIRDHLIKCNKNKKVNDLHKLAINYVKSSSIASIYLALNFSNSGKSDLDYKHATGFEALIGYLYLDKQLDRLEYLVDKSIKFIENI